MKKKVFCLTAGLILIALMAACTPKQKALPFEKIQTQEQAQQATQQTGEEIQAINQDIEELEKLSEELETVSKE